MDVNKNRNFSRYFAKIAAFITILTFIADPFAQQLVQYVDFRLPNPDMPATLARANYNHRLNDVSQDKVELGVTVGT